MLPTRVEAGWPGVSAEVGHAWRQLLATGGTTSVSRLSQETGRSAGPERAASLTWLAREFRSIQAGPPLSGAG
jgi:hypothetical protein